MNEGRCIYKKPCQESGLCDILYARNLGKCFYKEGNIKGGGGGNQYHNLLPQYRKKNWQIPKHRVENRRNTDTAFYDRSRLLNVLSISRVFYLKHVCTRNQAQPSRENVTISRKARLVDALPIPS